MHCCNKLADVLFCIPLAQVKNFTIALWLHSVIKNLVFFVCAAKENYDNKI